MVTTSDDGLDYYRDIALGTVSAPIDTIAVGVGTADESTTDASLADEVYRSDGANVRFIEGGAPGEFTATIDIQGGTEVAGGTTITEIVAIASGVGLAVTRDVFSGVTLDAGYSEGFQLPLDINRGGDN